MLSNKEARQEFFKVVAKPYDEDLIEVKKIKDKIN